MTMTSPISRRDTLFYLGAAAVLPLLPASAHTGMMPRLTLYGPPAGPSVTLAHAVVTKKLHDVSGHADFVAWRNPDELRAGLTSGEILLSVVPVQAAANLYNRGFPIRLANVMTNGLLYVTSDKREIAAISDLKGRSLAVPFRGDTPEIILGQLLEHHGLDAENDLDITYAGTPVEAMQLLLSGRVDAALAAEPAATAGILRGKKAGRTIHRVVSIQDAWGDMTGAEPALPQAGLAVMQTFLDAHPDALPLVLEGLQSATAEVIADPLRAAGHATQALGLPPLLLAASVPYCNLVARPAPEARADIERMLTAMAGSDLKKIGGRLPDDGFYL